MAMPEVMKDIVTESLDFIHNNSINILNHDITWDYSADPDQRMEHSKVVEFPMSTPTIVVGTLAYTSPHESIVEYGGILAKTVEKEEGAFPIGKQEYGVPVMYSSHFEVVQRK